MRILVNKGDIVRLNKLVLFVGVVFAVTVFAEDSVATESWLLQILTFVSTIKGASTVAIAAGVVQLVMIFFKTPLAAFAGKTKLLLVSALTVPALLLAAMATGVTWQTALGQAPVLAAFQSLLFQIWKQFFEPSGPQHV